MCLHCQKKFSSQDQLKKHFKLIHIDIVEKEWIKCPLCYNMFENKISLKLHFSLKHKTLQALNKKKRKRKRTKECEFCHLMISGSRIPHCNSAHLDKIMSVWQLCHLCGLYCPPNTMNSHIQSKHPSVQCTFCPLKFTNTNFFIEHANQIHTTQVTSDWLMCTICSLYLPTQKDMYGHIITSHKKSQHLCSFCSKDFNFKRSLLLHVQKTHSDAAAKLWLKCDSCNFFLSDKFEMENHYCKPYQQIQCEFCLSVFKKEIGYINHANKAHSSEISKTWFPCKYCHLALPSSPRLANHFCIDFCRFQISCECSENFFLMSNLIVHANKYHKEEIIEHWLCCIPCQQFYPNKIMLQMHQRKTHFEHLKIHICLHCPSRFRTEVDLNYHLKRVHQDVTQKTLKSCALCKKKLNNNAALETHLKRCKLRERTNTGRYIKMTMCKVCSIQLKVRNYEKHIKNCPKKTKRRKQNSFPRKTCEFCFQLVGQSSAAKSYHLNTKHKDKIPLGWVTCLKCNWFYSSIEILNNHQAFCSDQSTGPENSSESFQCLKCPEMFYRRQIHLYYKHARQEHFEIISSAWHPCQTCQKYYPDKEILQKHTR